MTGNTTSTALDIVQGWLARPRDPVKVGRLRDNAWLMVVFLLGCLAGGFLAWEFGLADLVLPGVMLLVYFRYFRGNKPVVV